MLACILLPMMNAKKLKFSIFMAFIKKFYGYLMKVQFRLYAQWAYATTQLGRVVQSQQ